MPAVAYLDSKKVRVDGMVTDVFKIGELSGALLCFLTQVSSNLT